MRGYLVYFEVKKLLIQLFPSISNKAQWKVVTMEENTGLLLFGNLLNNKKVYRSLIFFNTGHIGKRFIPV